MLVWAVLQTFSVYALTMTAPKGGYDGSAFHLGTGVTAFFSYEFQRIFYAMPLFVDAYSND